MQYYQKGDELMYRFICGIIKAFMCLIFRIEVKNPENIPSDGAFILCAVIWEKNIKQSNLMTASAKRIRNQRAGKKRNVSFRTEAACKYGYFQCDLRSAPTSAQSQ